MNKLVIFLLIYLFNFGNLFGQSLKVIYGDRLFYIYKKNLYLIKKVDTRYGLFRGYDVIDSTHIFIAYEPATSAEASTILAVYDINQEKEYFIHELGGTGESFFHYNKDNGLVVFNWIDIDMNTYSGRDAIYVYKLDLSKLKSLTAKDFKPKLIFKCEKGCFTPFWVDKETIGYQVWENGKFVTKYYKLKKQF